MSTNHVLPLPIPVVALRGAQLLLGIIILGLSAWGLSIGSFDAASLTIFTAIITLIIGTYNIVSFYAVKAAYNYWASLALDILAIVFWLTSMGLMASFVSSFVTYNSDCSFGFCYKRDLHPRAITDANAWLNGMKAVAGLAGLELVLFIATLIFTSIFLHKHRAAGGHSMPVKSTTTGTTGTPGATIAPQYNERKDIEMEAGAASQQYPVYSAAIPTAPPAHQQFAAPQQYPVYVTPQLTAPGQQVPQ